MKYYIVEIQISPEDASTQAIYEVTGGIDAAVTAWHGSMNSMRTAVDAGTLKEATGFILNSWGGVDPKYNEHYTKEAVEG